MLISPDTTATLTGGALALIIIREVFNLIRPLIQKTANGNGIKTSGTIAQQAQLRDAQNQVVAAQKQLDELKAGSQPVEFWVRKYDESAAKANQPLLRNQEEIMRTLREVIESQRRIRIRLKMEEDDN